MINGHGDDIYKHKDEIVSNFSSNIYAKQDMTALQEYLCSQLLKIHSYPEADAFSLNVMLAEQHKISSENIALTNGATEAIYLLAQAWQGSQTAIVIPTFSEYEDACTINKHQLRYYRNIDEIEYDIQMLWVCNPNNPDGKIYDIKHLQSIVERHPDVLFVFDQSYASFTEAEVWDVKEASRYPNVILLHSMTKQYVIPGLRLGYITAHESLIKKVNAFQMPWSVNVLAVEAGKFLLKNTPEEIDIKSYLKEAKNLQKTLNAIEGLQVLSSPMHYFLCRLENKRASDLKQWLIEQHGILIRDASNFRGLDAHYFRIATQSTEENKKLIKAIKEWI